MTDEGKTKEELIQELQDLRARCADAKETLSAIRSGEVDAIVVSGELGERVYTLKGAEYPYRVFIEEMTEGAVTLSADGTILYSNTRFAQMVKAPMEKIRGSSMYKFLKTTDQQIFQAMMQHCLEGSTKGELILSATDGTLVTVYLSLNALQLDELQVVCVVITDLTQQKRNEQIVASEKLARSILDQASEAIVVCDMKGQIFRTNEAAYRLVGVNPMLQHFDNIFDLQLHSEDQHPYSLNQHKLFSITSALRRHVLRGVEARLYRKDRKILTVLISAGPLLNAQNSVVGCVVTLIDISDRKRAEQELSRFRLIGDPSRQVHLIMNSDGRLLYVNDLVCERFGYTEKELLEMSLNDLDPNFSKIEPQSVLEHLQRETPPSIPLSMRRKDGDLFVGEMVINGAKFDGEILLFGMIRNQRDSCNQSQWPENNGHNAAAG